MNLLLAAGDGHDVHFLFDPHGFGLVFWTGLIFAIVALILYKKTWGPILEALDRREKSITGAIDEAAAVKAEAEATKARYEDQLENIRQDADAIIQEGEADKRRIVQLAHAKASKEAAEIRARAERDIVLAKQKALSEVKVAAAQLGVLIAEKVIKAEVDAKKHQAVVDEVIANYEAGKG